MTRRVHKAHTRTRSLLISVVGGVALLLLAVTVFAVASQASSLSTQAERAVQTVENLRVVSLARVEISVASRINESAPQETLLISGAIENASVALDSVQASFDDTTSDEVRAAFTDFENAANNQAEALTQSTQDDDLQRDAELATGEAFAVLSETMRAEQIEAIAGLEADNDLMNLIATVSTFIVAFVVPSAALFVFQALRTAPREMRELELEYDRLEKRSQAMARTISHDSAELRKGLAATPPSVSENQVKQTLARFEHISAANGGPTSVRNESVDVNKVLASVIDDLDGSIDVAFSPASNPMTHADPAGLALIVTELMTNARIHGAAPFEISAISTSEQIEIQFIDSGNGIADDIVNAVLHEQAYELRQATLEGIHGYGLAAIRHALESMGGTLRYARHNDRTYLLASLPVTATATEPHEEFPVAA